MAAISNPIFQNADKAREALEAVRWPNGPVCPHCGGTDRNAKVEGEKQNHRAGLYYCNDCRGQFTVTVGTVFERSKVPLNKWWLAVHLLCSSKKGMSAHQLHRTLGVTYKTAWFMMHRIREAMRDGSLAGPLGGGGGIVEADETYFGKTEMHEPSPKRKGRPYTKGGRSGPSGKRTVVALVERGGKVRTFHPEKANGENVTAIVSDNIAREARFMTDESRLYITIGKEFASHETTLHSRGEYVRGDVHTNTVEGYFSIFKRGMKGVYQHCSEKHLHRYLAEFDFRYNNRTALEVSDTERTVKAMAGIEGKRLTYRRVNSPDNMVPMGA
jgi:transposase-like protein